MLLNYKGQTYEIINWDEFRRKVLFLLGEGIVNAIQDEALKLGLFKTGRYIRGFHSYVDESGQLNIDNDVYYACVDGRSRILTKRGVLMASQIRVGDLLLTQSGVYKPVEKVFKRKLKKGDVAIKIISEYRKGRNHELFVTPEHKVLVFRDGCNKWVKASEVKVNDYVFTKIKKAHNKGSGIKRYCLNCGVKTKRKKFCSVDCRTSFWNKGHNPHTGMKRSLNARRKMREKAREKFDKNPELHPSRILAQRGYKTNIEKELENFLKSININFESQKKVGNHFVDAYCEDIKTIFEADGAFWHKNQQKDIERDKELQEVLGDDWKIIHLHFFDKRFSPQIIENPIPNVHYVVTNPGPESYINPDVFKKSKVIKVIKKEFKTDDFNRWGYKPFYDFQIKDIHSYYANGMIVSNSYLEYGTFEYFDLYGLDDFPDTPIKKKDLSREERTSLPKGMAPFAPIRRVLYNQEKIDQIIREQFG